MIWTEAQKYPLNCPLAEIGDARAAAYRADSCSFCLSWFAMTCNIFAEPHGTKLQKTSNSQLVFSNFLISNRREINQLQKKKEIGQRVETK